VKSFRRLAIQGLSADSLPRKEETRGVPYIPPNELRNGVFFRHPERIAELHKMMGSFSV
jgi:hypothetical protein